MANLFERLSRAQPTATAIERPSKKPEQLLLDFIARWPRATISSRDIRIWGPKAIRSREKAIRSAQILAARGWLLPLKNRVWQIVREPLTPTRSP